MQHMPPQKGEMRQDAAVHQLLEGRPHLHLRCSEYNIAGAKVDGGSDGDHQRSRGGGCILEITAGHKSAKISAKPDQCSSGSMYSHCGRDIVHTTE